MEVSGNTDNESNLQAVYSLPRASNATERGRLDARHKGLMLSLRGLYTPVDKVREALRLREDGRQPAILDVGTGAGNWCALQTKCYHQEP
ncbi:hypothetical protein FRC05_007991 [Tulasnella sp. 425]|nr:hypothetical protein FRC05_007991 [Tulasnella sp. 425]